MRDSGETVSQTDPVSLQLSSGERSGGSLCDDLEQQVLSEHQSQTNHDIWSKSEGVSCLIIFHHVTSAVSLLVL